jgi:3-methyladenine DNA glycosylase AlkD
MPNTLATATAATIVAELKKLGTASYKKVMLNHGIPEPFFGVKISDLKKIVSRVKKNHELSQALYATGNYDAMYLAGLIADEKVVSAAELRQWAKAAKCSATADFTVGAVAADSAHGFVLGLEWIDAKQENLVIAGWGALAGFVSVVDDSKLDVKALGKLLDRVAKGIHGAPSRVRYSMNTFVIACGGYVAALTEQALAVAKAMGKVEVDMGNTSCLVPDAAVYIAKKRGRGAVKKRKSARC